MSTVAAIQIDALKTVTPRSAIRVILAISAVAVLALVFVIYGHGRAEAPPAWISLLPALNAALNATSATFLVLAFRSIKRKKSALHARQMLAAMAASALFLASYVVYHSVHGDTKFMGQGMIRPVYFFILISHVLLSVVVLPLVFSSFFLSLSGRFPMHKKVSRYTFPMWLYVSVTGVLVFALLRVYG